VTPESAQHCRTPAKPRSTGLTHALDTIAVVHLFTEHVRTGVTFLEVSSGTSIRTGHAPRHTAQLP
jgi:hypothetical protein